MTPDPTRENPPEKLVVLWTSGDRYVPLKMIFPYLHSSARKKWWKEITLIIWGPSTKLLSSDRELRDHIGNLKDEEIRLRACRTCAESYGVVPELEGLGIEVILMGEPLTGYLKDPGTRVITF